MPTTTANVTYPINATERQPKNKYKKYKKTPFGTTRSPSIATYLGLGAHGLRSGLDRE